MSVGKIFDAVHDGRMTPAQGAMLLELRRELQRRARRRRTIQWLLLVPLWRWIGRRIRR